jgi:hypothetical protein
MSAKIVTIAMNKLVTNPLFVMIVGGFILGLGVDFKVASVWIPGATILVAGLFVGLHRMLP